MPRLVPWLSVAQNIAFELGAAGSEHPLVPALLDEVGLSSYADALAKQLSGGQARRVAIARGLFTQARERRDRMARCAFYASGIK